MAADIKRLANLFPECVCLSLPTPRGIYRTARTVRRVVIRRISCCTALLATAVLVIFLVKHKESQRVAERVVEVHDMTVAIMLIQRLVKQHFQAWWDAPRVATMSRTNLTKISGCDNKLMARRQFTHTSDPQRLYRGCAKAPRALCSNTRTRNNTNGEGRKRRQSNKGAIP